MKIVSVKRISLMRKDQIPDIDVDFESGKRDEVKRYIERKYGKDYVCSIGTYNRLKPKGAIKDFARCENIEFSKVNFVTKQIKHRINYIWSDIIEDALNNGILKEWILKNSDLMNLIKPILNQAKTTSIHASAVVIVPKEDKDGNPMTIFDWMPVRKIWDKGSKQHVLISEWEGKSIDKVGFLKEDVLSLLQLDKFKYIVSSVKKLRGEEIVLEEIPLDDEEVFKIFQKGYNEGVFQFGSSGLKRYSVKVRPDSMEDLIAMNALFRPGPMRSKAHEDFADIKHGRKEPKFDYGLKQVTEKTGGLYVYQEQIMQSVHLLGKLSLSEADEVRTIMKKFDKKKMATFRDKFIKGAIENGCDDIEAVKIWDKLERFSGYGFNRSHSAAYSIMGYWCQWLKCHYPEEFYSAALNFSKNEIDVSSILNEIELRKLKLNINPPDINESKRIFVVDVEQSQIYWSLVEIKGIGIAATKTILNERKNGKFRSVGEFLKRLKGKGVGRGATELLIKAGAFDKLENIKKPKGRKVLMKELFKLSNIKDEEFEKKYNWSKFNRDYGWIYEQRRLTGFGNIDYGKLIAKSNKKMAKYHRSVERFINEKKQWKKVTMVGRIVRLFKRNSKKGEYAIITLRINNSIIEIILWSEVWNKWKKLLEDVKKRAKIIAISGKIKYDDYREQNMLYSDVNFTQVIEL